MEISPLDGVTASEFYRTALDKSGGHLRLIRPSAAAARGVEREHAHAIGRRDRHRHFEDGVHAGGKIAAQPDDTLDGRLAVGVQPFDEELDAVGPPAADVPDAAAHD